MCRTVIVVRLLLLYFRILLQHVAPEAHKRLKPVVITSFPDHGRISEEHPLRYWKELKEVSATQGQRTSPMHNPQFPSFHEADTQSLFSAHWNSDPGK
jgi:hypothetical protein